MSRADARTKILQGAAALGAAEGVGALSLQGIATAAGVSKPLVLYHFGDKDRVLAALGETLADGDAVRIAAAATAPDALEAWRALPRDRDAQRRCVLLAALALESGVREHSAAWRQRRLTAATALAVAILRGAGLAPRHPPALLGGLALQQLDGLAAAAAAQALDGDATDARQDAFALALLALGD